MRMPERCAGHLLVPPALKAQLDPSVCWYSVQANVIMMMVLLTGRSMVSTIICRGKAAATIDEEHGTKMEVPFSACNSKVCIDTIQLRLCKHVVPLCHHVVDLCCIFQLDCLLSYESARLAHPGFMWVWSVLCPVLRKTSVVLASTSCQ